MNNFLVKVHTDDDQIREELHNQFAQNVFSRKTHKQASHDSEQWEEPPRYILSEHYVDTYLTPFLIRSDEEGDPYHCVFCQLDVRRGAGTDANKSSPSIRGDTTTNGVTHPNDVTPPNGVTPPNDVTPANIDPRSGERTLQVQLCASHIYFENMETERYHVKTNERGYKFQQYMIKNRDVLLVHGSCRYGDRDLCSRRTDVKGLYEYIRKNREDVEKALNSLEGSFFLLYIHYSNEHANMYFCNDAWGMKSVIFFYGQSSILLTNSYAFFINYHFNYTKGDGVNYLFDNSSVNERLNLIHYDGVFGADDEVLPKWSGSPMGCSEEGDFTPQSIINDKVGIQINPYYIYNVNIFERTKVVLKSITKRNSIYTKDIEWSNDHLSVQENFHRICNFVERHYFTYSGNREEWTLLKCTIQESLKDYIDGDSNKRRDAETVLNNCFVQLYMNLLRGVIERKIEEVFSKKEDQYKVEENHLNDACENEKKKKKERKNFLQNIPFTVKCDNLGGKVKSVGILFSGGIDSTLLALTTIRAYFNRCTDGYVELINVCFDDNAVDRYTSLISYEQIVKLHPQYDIRLVFVDVSPEDLLKYEKIIFSLMSPNNSTMDFNISAAFFFANLGRGVLFSRSFFQRPEWAYIKGRVSSALKVPGPKEADSAVTRGVEADKTEVDTTEADATETKSKCRICQFVRSIRCIHRCCSVCCRKVRYVYRKEFYQGRSSHTSRSGDIYQMESNESRDSDVQRNYGERSLFIMVKKKKVLINFKIFGVCPAHKERVYDYERIDSLFREFQRELGMRQRDIDGGHEEGQGNSTHEEPKDSAPSCADMFRDTRYENFIDQFVAKHAENDPQKFEQIKSLFYVKSKREGNNAISMDQQKKEKFFIDEDESPQKEETLNYLKRDLYQSCSGSHYIEQQGSYQCNHHLLIIGSGADELFGGYYRQNNRHLTKGESKQTINFKKNEMIKDLRRIWTRNLYRDDRILTFTSFTNKVLCYPYLDMHLVNFLFMVSFYIVEAPLGGLGQLEGPSCFPENAEKEKPSNVECSCLYEHIRTHKVSKWVLRMAIFFSHCKELMLFKKKAIQFGSKSKNVQMYMREWISRKSGNITGRETSKAPQASSKLLLPSDKKKGTDRYILLS
ncbi:asparagine synthase, putative [Plasmodium knowlesi strain H]|uniref:Asparagine synthase, putative n=3 Tax=Plasmodium knowlesi TaxID=5850 RepID=A0A5K1U6V5_PLAKH|nr:asparagine synthase, putative [Plasmodium knowlesi strain H]OTN65484.1 putative Asparagine synthase [Plasmodium knowlesi]CAA9989374.1 asparagine synthase, putative [Plasmodium knowlesi strain H]SBO24957.1 asparagine synthase, putative [Plasmodium knowlesi strain H]SBO27898.1 asparagine synthase, putative [Plasmodium knowlesi strain H]VVS78848.1 asparagine synthase, putative [Plasmodium knowlesi strain H]|eukprot:XP_002260101.1 asparagine synthase, putative [Plasmodium knowlesi strain H]